MTCARANWKEWCVLNNCVVPQWVKHGVILVNTAPRTLTVKKAILRTSTVGSVLVSQQSEREVCMFTACYALRNIKHIVPIDALRVIYFTHIHSIISYGIIFWGSSSYANKVFILQKKIIRILTNTRPRDSCREAFKSMEIMTLYSQ